MYLFVRVQCRYFRRIWNKHGVCRQIFIRYFTKIPPLGEGRTDGHEGKRRISRLWQRAKYRAVGSVSFKNQSSLQKFCCRLELLTSGSLFLSRENTNLSYSGLVVRRKTHHFDGRIRSSTLSAECVVDKPAFSETLNFQPFPKWSKTFIHLTITVTLIISATTLVPLLTLSFAQFWSKPHQLVHSCCNGHCSAIKVLRYAFTLINFNSKVILSLIVKLQ